MLIDIHTHIKRDNPNHLEFLDDRDFVGLHPWFIKAESVESDFQQISNRHRSNSIAFIGETGLDKLKSTVDFELQRKIFLDHINLAIELNRPLVIHCLKAHQEFLSILKELNFKGKFLIHDYSGSEVEMKRYLQFDAFFSFGRSLFRENSKAQMVFKHTPVDRIFLETDDDKNLTIEKVYDQAKILINRSDLEDQILKNFLTLFKYSDYVRPADFPKNLC